MGPVAAVTETTSVSTEAGWLSDGTYVPVKVIAPACWVRTSTEHALDVAPVATRVHGEPKIHTAADELVMATVPAGTDGVTVGSLTVEVHVTRFPAAMEPGAHDNVIAVVGALTLNEGPVPNAAAVDDAVIV